ncbi:MAG: hypothetical protein M1817_006017 [Caeruleum heppii]|nr:MAG: hypothetical protein M1817_006017 [Caeruleum heppii]
MTKLILSTSNIMNGYPSIIRNNAIEQSNTELTTSLRTNITASQEAAVAGLETPNGAQTPNGTSSRPPLPSWTTRRGSTLEIPVVDWPRSGLIEERSQYDITVKLFYLPNLPTCQRGAQAREALGLVLKELKVPYIDLLIVSFPGVAFNADEEEELASQNGCDESTDRRRKEGGKETMVEDLETMLVTWKSLEELHIQGLVRKLGVSEFGSKRLKELLHHANIRPSVDQINVRDCCVVPKPLMRYAKEERIELLTHNDCTNILPPGTVREILGTGGKGVGALGDSNGPNDALQGDVMPQWVVKYTAVVRDRGVVENKGYFAGADLSDS